MSKNKKQYISEDEDDDDHNNAAGGSAKTLSKDRFSNNWRKNKA